MKHAGCVHVWQLEIRSLLLRVGPELPCCLAVAHFCKSWVQCNALPYAVPRIISLRGVSCRRWTCFSPGASTGALPGMQRHRGRGASLLYTWLPYRRTQLWQTCSQVVGGGCLSRDSCQALLAAQSAHKLQQTGQKLV